LKRFIGRLIQNKFVRNVAIVASGTAGAQAITLAFSPIITRLYGPEAFGLLGTFTAVLAIGSAIAGLTYPVAIVLPKNNHEAIGLMRLSIGLSVVMTTLLTLLLLLSGKHLASAFGLQGIGSLILLIPIGMFFASLHQIFSQWLNPGFHDPSELPQFDTLGIFNYLIGLNSTVGIRNGKIDLGSRVQEVKEFIYAWAKYRNLILTD